MLDPEEGPLELSPRQSSAVSSAGAGSPPWSWGSCPNSVTSRKLHLQHLHCDHRGDHRSEPPMGCNGAVFILQHADAVSQTGDLPGIQLQDKLPRIITTAIPNLYNYHLVAFTLLRIYFQISSGWGLYPVPMRGWH